MHWHAPAQPNAGCSCPQQVNSKFDVHLLMCVTAPCHCRCSRNEVQLDLLITLTVFCQLKVQSAGAGCSDCFCVHHCGIQQKVCIQTCALLYIGAFCCTPNCHGIVSQLITGNYVIRVQLSARGIATCFASAQPKAQVSGGVDCPCPCPCPCLPSQVKVKKSNSNHSGKFSGTCK